MVQTDKLKRYQGDASESWLTKQPHGIGDAGSVEPLAPVSPVMSGSPTGPDWARSEVKYGTDTSPYLINEQRLPAHRSAHRPNEEPAETLPAPVSG